MESLKANVHASQVVTKALIDRVGQLVSGDDSEVVKHTVGSMKFSVMTRPEHIDGAVLERLRYILPWIGSS